MDIVDLIKDDHEQVSELFDKIIATTEQDAAERETLFTELRGLLESHTKAEERIVYERLESEDVDALADLIPESYDEHTTVVDILQALSEMEPNNREWMDKFSALVDNVQDHVEKEEKILLPILMKVCDDGEREEMADDMKSLEEDIFSAGPELTTQTPAQSHVDTML